MKNKIKKFIRFLNGKKLFGAVMLIIITAAGAFLPSAVIEHDDSKTADSIVLIETEKINLESKNKSNLTVLQKMEAIHSYRSFEMDAARNYNTETIIEQANKKLLELSARDIIEPVYDYEVNANHAVVKTPVFYINYNVPDNNFFAWRVKLQTTGDPEYTINRRKIIYSVELIIDDETGNVLSLDYSCFYHNCKNGSNGGCEYCNIYKITDIFYCCELYMLNDNHYKSENIKTLENGAKEYSVLVTDGSRESINVPIVIEQRRFKFN